MDDKFRSPVFEKGEEQDSEAGEETTEEPFDEDVDLYNNVLRKMLPGILRLDNIYFPKPLVINELFALHKQKTSTFVIFLHIT